MGLINLMGKNNISFILHKPQLSENIGACARGMKNFDFKKLILINPRPIFPNDKILATSVGAKAIVNKAEVYNNLEQSIEKIDILIATSARFRNKNIKHISLEDLKKIDFKKKIGFLFGSEASGLSNNEISYANYTLQIPTNLEFRSLNLSHSLIIIAQYISNLIKNKTKILKKSKKVKTASKKEVQSMINLCINNLEEINFFKPKEKRPIMVENLRNIFYKMDLSDKETRILSSVFASLGKKR
jgi:tRNA/rRNA methyltransferase